ncbi:MAG TPA: putative toxin-antitoxin system toxin component, PIN family [Thermoanaerobaculia bacterium]|nr:putative toxin-antitoxin system toxin component, PIN family [Thermoanaerobaculia bacterium]
MRAVADTNVVISGLLWNGPSRAVLDRARSGAVDLFTSPALLAELEDVLARRKFLRRLQLARTSVHELILGYASLAHVIRPAPIEPIVLADPDDDAVLACALAARVDVIVSGDGHLLALGQVEGIRVVTAAGFLALTPSPR